VSVPRLPILQDSNDDCPGGLPGRRKLIDFSQKVSNVSALLLNHSDHPVTYTICDDQAGVRKLHWWARRLPPFLSQRTTFVW
jgi:hypothetical protein